MHRAGLSRGRGRVPAGRPPRLRRVTMDRAGKFAWGRSGPAPPELEDAYRRRAGYPPEADPIRLPGHHDREGQRGQVHPADRLHLRAWLARSADRDDVLRVIYD